jgi:hypothetical protein
VNAHIKFLHTGADGIPLAQAFAFFDGCREQQTLQRGYQRNAEYKLSDVVQKQTPIDAVLETLRESVRQLSGMLTSRRRTRSKG